MVKEIVLGDLGRKELTIAETEMPRLMACSEKFAAPAP